MTLANSRRGAFALCCILWLAGSARVAAQQESEQRAAAERRLSEHRVALAQRELEIEDIIDAMTLHSLGAREGSPDLPLVGGVMRERAEVEAELLAEEQHVEQLRALLATRVAELRVHGVATTVQMGEEEVVPAALPADTPSPAPAVEVAPVESTPEPKATTAEPASTGGEPTPASTPLPEGVSEEAELALEGRGLAGAVRDPLLLGRALFRAGRFDLARPLLLEAAELPSAGALQWFSYARCCERMGDYEAADRALQKIEAMDTHTAADGSASLGRWGLAANLARKQMLWMRDHGSATAR